MKKILVTLVFFCAVPAFLMAQVQTPQPSPHAHTEQMVGLTKITVDYSRPGVKDREIFGALVPYGEIWRTGANKNTTITFSDDVVVNGERLNKGTYALFTKPGKENWEVYFYEDIENWGVPQKWDEEKIALQTEAKVMKMPMEIETFTILVDQIRNEEATLNFIWENTMAEIDIAVPTEEKTLESIETTMNANPTANDYFAAASYYLSEEKDMEQALQWMEKAEEINDGAPFYMLHQKALIQNELGMKKEAMATAKESLAAAKKAENEHYIQENEILLKKLKAK